MEQVILGLLILLVIILLYINYGKTYKGRKHRVPNDRWEQVPVDNPQVMRIPAASLTSVDDDYNDYVLTAGLDQSVVDSHRNFVSQIQKSTTGASTLTELSGDVYATPFVGLRRPDLQSIYIDPNSRVVPSEDQAIMPKGNKYYKCGLF